MKLVEDRRVGGTVSYHLLREDEELPQVPPHVLKCVAFAYPREGHEPEGTVFFVSISERDPEPTQSDDFHWVYAVTAAHVIRALPQGIDIRVNRLNGNGTQRIKTARRGWTIHRSTDVAILQMPLPADADCIAFPARSAVNDDLFQSGLAGPGDDVILAGLFSHQAGKFQNTPVVRGGILAALPGEDIKTRDYGAWPAYLIEARSTPGMSGLPAFLNITGYRRVASPLAAMAGRPPEELYDKGRDALWRGGTYLLGVGHGHFNDIRHRRRPRTSMIDKINTGIGIVIPFERVMDLIQSAEEKDMRRKDIEKRDNTKSQSIQADRANVEFTKEGFENTLKRVSRRVDPGPRGRGKKGP